MSDYKAKMHQNRFRLGLSPRPTGRAYSAPPDHLAVFKGPTSKRKEGKGEEEGKGRGREGKREGRGREEEGKGGEEKGENDFTHPLSQIPAYATGVCIVPNGFYSTLKQMTLNDLEYTCTFCVCFPSGIV